MWKTLASLAVSVAATVMPQAPAGLQPVRATPLSCPHGQYMVMDYDTNPSTKAALRLYQTDDGKTKMAVKIEDDGYAAIFTTVGGMVHVAPLADVAAKFPRPCDALEATGV